MSFPALRLGLLYFIICFPGSQAFQHGLELRVAIVCVCVCVCVCIHSHILLIYVADYICIYIKCMCAVCSVVPDSLRPHGLLPTRLLCSWISQAGILEWVTISFSRGSSPPRDQPVTPTSPALAGRSLPLSHMGSPIYTVYIYIYIHQTYTYLSVFVVLFLKSLNVRYMIYMYTAHIFSPLVCFSEQH